MKNVKSNKIQSFFYGNKMPWWLIGVSMVMGSGILVQPQIVSSALAKGGLSNMWMLWSEVIGVAAGVVFFAHLWRNVPIKTENELLLFRFSGIGARWLHGFRSIYVGAFVVPCILAFSILGFSNLVSFILGWSKMESIITTVIIVLIGTFFNRFTQRIRIDFVLLFVFILILALILPQIFIGAGGLSHIQESIASTNLNFQLFPSIGSIAFNNFLVFICLYWWSASILDMPDMKAQKLMTTRSSGDLVKSIILPELVVFLIGLFTFILPFIVWIRRSFSEFSNPELAYFSVFTDYLSTPFMILAVIMFLIAFLSVTHNNQNWGGSLLVQNFYKYYIKPSANERDIRNAGLFVMCMLVIVAGFFAYFSTSLFGIVRYIFSITAGVGPIFILRWYWWRINAWTQLSAMVSALILSAVYDLLIIYSPAFNEAISSLCFITNIDFYPLEIILLSIVVSAIWISVTFLTKPTDDSTIKRFVETIHPSGFWGKHSIPNQNKMLPIRFLIWILIAIKGVLAFVIFINFAKGNYTNFGILLCFYLLIFYLSYRWLNNINSKN